MSISRKLLLLASPVVTICAISSPVVAADQTALKACMAEMAGEIGLSPDLAYSECKRKTIVGCITALRGKFITLEATSKVKDGYLFDLGNDKKVWQDEEVQRRISKGDPVLSVASSSNTKKVSGGVVDGWFNNGLN